MVYNGEELSFYDATQKQRAIERKIREWKRRASALEESGLNDPDTLSDIARCKSKVKDWQATMRDFLKQTGLDRDRIREQVQLPRKTIGLSFLSGDTQLKSIEDAVSLGQSSDGWEKNEKILKEKYLPQFKLKDDVDQTVGFWGGPEPSFNARVSGTRDNVLAMAKAWGKDYNQQAMALLLPNPNGSGGRLVWDFGKILTDDEMNQLFRNITLMNEEYKKLHQGSENYFGITTKGNQIIEFWFDNDETSKDAKWVINQAIGLTNLPVYSNREVGYEFKLLFADEDY